MKNNFFIKVVIFFTLTLSAYADCDVSLENPHTLECGGFTMDIGGFSSPCCSYNNVNFDIFDDFRSGTDDKNISTKIINTQFDLNITSQEDFNGTICIQIKSDTNESDWTKTEFTNSKIVTIEDSNVTFISQEAEIFLKYTEETNSSDVNCSSSLDGTDSSIDKFAIRPKEFFILPSSSTINAGEEFNLSFISGYDSSNPSKDYNETNEDSNASFEVVISEIKNGCLVSSFNPNITKDVNFTDGTKTFANITYEEIGKVDVNISEEKINCDKRYSKIDCDDKNISSKWNTENELLITKKSETIKIIPHHFKVDITSSNKNGLFTYIANEITNINALVDVNITAQSENNNTTKNYNKSCYANDLNITFKYSNVDSNLTNFVYYYDSNHTTITTNPINSDISYELNSSYFKTDNNGSAIFKIHYNFKRDKSKPINPFDINITKFSVKDSVDNSLKGNGIDSSNSNFCFGRIKAKDVQTTSNDDFNHTIEIEVYDDSNTNYTQNFIQNSLKWYGHKNHTNLNDGNITEINATLNTVLNNVKFSISNTTNLNNGTIKITIPKDRINNYTMHIKTQPWLWYVYKNFGKDYNDSIKTQCIQHPCFNFLRRRSKNNSGVSPKDYIGISSGAYNGGDTNIQNSNYTKTGLKILK